MGSAPHIRIGCQSIFVLTLLATLCGHAHAQSTPASPAVQPPDLGTPERGSIAGALAGFAVGPETLARGSLSLSTGMSFPADYGAPLVDVLPTYKADGGLSPWGMGWTSELAISRHRDVGEIDFETDDFTSPWGVLAEGSDGAFYPVGLQEPVRISRDGTSWRAVDAEGTRFQFRVQVDGRDGVYAWYLDEVTSVLGAKTTLFYARNSSGHPFLERMTYGPVDRPDVIEVRFGYGSLPYAFEDLRSGVPLRVDRRVTSVEVRVRHLQTGQYHRRWRYALRHRPSPLGPAHYLTSVEKTYADGSAEPAWTFSYDYGKSLLDDAELRSVPELDVLLRQEGASAIHPDRATQIDIDRDGRIDLEAATDGALYHHTDQGWTREPLARSPTPDRRCLQSPSTRNAPRRLARMMGASGAAHVVTTRYASGRDQTDIVVCDRAGTLLYEGSFDGDWDLERGAKLVDLNRDHRPEIVRIDERGYRVLENRSTVNDLRFTALPWRDFDARYTDISRFYLSDFNGDSVIDIAAVTPRDMLVWRGRGALSFEPTPRFVELVDPDGEPFFDLDAYHLAFGDLNGDGLTEVILTMGNWSGVFYNPGDALRWYPLPALDGLPRDVSPPIPVDLVGSGDMEIVYTKGTATRALQVTQASTGLLVAASDGQGTHVTFEYERSPAVAGGVTRRAVLSRQTLSSVGQQPVIHEFAYADPVLHSIGDFLVGFARVDRSGPGSTMTAEFHHDDTVRDVLVASSTLLHDQDLVHFEERAYDDVSFRDVRWWRPHVSSTGWRSRGQIAHDRTTYAGYHHDSLCPSKVALETAHGTLTTETTLSDVSELDDALHCLADRTTRTGKHARSDLDFADVIEVDRNRVGQVTHEWRRTPGLARKLQEVDYDIHHRVVSVRRPGRGDTHAVYGTDGLLLSIRTPNLVSQVVASRDPVTLKPLRIDTERRGEPHRTWYRYDSLERLEAAWSSTGGGSATSPEESLMYLLPTDAALGRIHIRTRTSRHEAHYREMVSVTGADGESLAELSRIPEGWHVDSLSDAEPATLETWSFTRGPISSFGDDGLTPAELYASATTLGHSVLDAEGNVISASRLVQGPTRVASHARTLEQWAAQNVEDGLLVSTLANNDAPPRHTARTVSGDVLWSQDELGHRTWFTYDAARRLVEVELPDGTLHRRVLDDEGRPIRIERDGVGTATYAYDEQSGLLETVTMSDEAGFVVRTTTRVHDDAGRMIREIHSDAGSGAQSVFDFEYDGHDADGQRGHLTAVEGPHYRRAMHYGLDGRVDQVTTRLANWLEVSTAFTYTPAGDLETADRQIRRLDTGEVLDRSLREDHFDGFGRLDTILRNEEALATLHYDAEGRLDRIDVPNGVVVPFYDDLTRARTGHWVDGGGFVAGVERALDRFGRTGEELITLDDEERLRRYGYDDRGFLTSVEGDEHPTSYLYDSTGIMTFAEDHRGDRAISPPGETRPTDTYGYDALGRLARRGDLSLRYGPDGRLAKAQRGSETRTYVYDEAGHRVLEMRGGVPSFAFVDGVYIDGTQVLEPFEVAGVMAGVLANGRFELLSTDSRGTVLVDEGGQLSVPTPYGVRSEPLALGRALDFVSKGFDPFLGTVRLGVRDYDPHVGRFDTPDPLFFSEPTRCAESPLECNLYAYAKNDPLGFVDPTGTQANDADGDSQGGTSGSSSSSGSSSGGAERPATCNTAVHPPSAGKSPGETAAEYEKIEPPPPPPPTEQQLREQALVRGLEIIGEGLERGLITKEEHQQLEDMLFTAAGKPTREESLRFDPCAHGCLAEYLTVEDTKRARDAIGSLFGAVSYIYQTQVRGQGNDYAIDVAAAATAFEGMLDREGGPLVPIRESTTPITLPPHYYE